MDIMTILLVILLVVGIVLAFFGIVVWNVIMGILGGFIGWFIGFGLAYYFTENWLIAIIAGFICGFLGSMLFHYVVEAALALVVGVLAGAVVFYIGGADPANTLLVVIAVIIFAVVFAVAFYFMDELIGVFTALVGSVLAGAALWLLTGDTLLAVGLGLLIFFGGAALQTFVLTD